MARLKHLLLIIAVKALTSLRRARHGAVKLLTALRHPLHWSGKIIFHFALMPPYWATQKLRLLSHRWEWQKMHNYRVSLNAGLALVIIIITVTAISNYTSPIAKAEDFGRTAMIGAIVQPSDEFDEEQLWTEGPLNSSSTTSLTYYLEPAELQPELEAASPPGPPDNLAMSSGPEDALIAVTSLPPSTRTRNQIETYAVQSGDTLSSIARRFGLKVATLLWANNLSERSLLKLGQNLTIPPVNGVVYTVKKGETLASIAAKYKVTAADITDFNKLADNQLKVGLTLMIPGGQPAAAPVAVAVKPSQLKNVPVPPAASVNRDTPLFWPTTSHRLTQYFGWRHPGVDIGNKVGQPIYAADDGVVVRAQWNSGYGYNVVLDHGNGMRTLYGHSSKLLVSPGQHVSRGAVIALIGSTGRSTGPHLHFEVIVGGVKKNPLSYTR